MYLLRKIIHEILKVDPGIRWVACKLSQNTEKRSEFWFTAEELEINGARIKLSSVRQNWDGADDEKKIITFEKIDKILRTVLSLKESISNSFFEELPNEILPKRFFTKNSEVGACEGALLIICSKSKINETISICLEEPDKQYKFDKMPNFQGFVLNYEEKKVSTFPDDELPIVFPGKYLAALKETNKSISQMAIQFSFDKNEIKKFEILNEIKTDLSADKDLIENNKIIKLKKELIEDFIKEAKISLNKIQKVAVDGIFLFFCGNAQNEKTQSGKTRNSNNLIYNNEIPKTFKGLVVNYKIKEELCKLIDTSEKLHIADIAIIKNKIPELKYTYEFSEDIADCLSGYDGPIEICNQSQLSPETAMIVVKHNGKGLTFKNSDSDGPQLTEKTAEILATYKGDLIFEDMPKLNCGDLASEIIIDEAFSNHKGGTLSFNNLRELSSGAAKKLFMHEKPIEIPQIEDEDYFNEEVRELYEHVSQKRSS